MTISPWRTWRKHDFLGIGVLGGHHKKKSRRGRKGRCRAGTQSSQSGYEGKYISQILGDLGVLGGTLFHESAEIECSRQMAESRRQMKNCSRTQNGCSEMPETAVRVN